MISSDTLGWLIFWSAVGAPFLLAYALFARWRLKSAIRAQERAELGRSMAESARELAIKGRDLADSARARAFEERSRALEELDRARTESDESRLQLKLARERNEELRGQVDRLANLEARIQHDLPKRLLALRKFLLENNPNSVDRDHAIAEMDIAVERVKLHLADDIAKYVAEERTSGRGRESDGVTVAGLVMWLAKILECEQRLQLEGDKSIQMLYKRVFWDLMLTNLLSNAFYHANPNGIVVVEISVQSDGLGRIDIANDGPPIPRSEADRVFTLGFSTKKGGRGLGLYVAQEIAKGMGARILPPTSEKNWIGRHKRVAFSIVDLPIVPADDDK